MPHADSPTTWRELVSDKSANITSNDNSHWTSDGYYFAVGPNGSERSYGYRSFSMLLREAAKLGLIEIHQDPKSGTVMVDGFCE